MGGASTWQLAVHYPTRLYDRAGAPRGVGGMDGAVYMSRDTVQLRLPACAPPHLALRQQHRVPRSPKACSGFRTLHSYGIP